MELYEYEKYISNEDNVKETLNKYGVAIIPSLLNELECDNMNNGMWDTLETITNKWTNPIKREDNKSWKELSKLFPIHSMLLQHWNIGHSQYVWDLRQNSKIVNIFSQIWNCKNEELLVSFDGVSYHMPPEITKRGWYRNKDWLHCDQCFQNNDFDSIQSWVTANDINEGDATLTFLEGSNNFHKDCSIECSIDCKKNWYKLNEKEMLFYKNKKCSLKKIKCPKGSLVLWDRRTIHCGSEAIKERNKSNIRNVAYLCYKPRQYSLKKNNLKRIKAFEEKRMTTHTPCKTYLFPKTPRTYGNPLPIITELQEPIINDLGRKLVGY